MVAPDAVPTGAASAHLVAGTIDTNALQGHDTCGSTPSRKAEGTKGKGVFTICYQATDGFTKDPGHIKEVKDSDDHFKSDTKKMHPNTQAHKDQHMFNASGYGYSHHQSIYYSPSPESCQSGYGPHLYGHVFQQAPSSVFQYYPLSQAKEDANLGSMTASAVDSISSLKQGHNSGYDQQVGYQCHELPDFPTQWGGYYGLPNFYDYYSSQWIYPAIGLEQNGYDYPAWYACPHPSGHPRYQGYSRNHALETNAYSGTKAGQGKLGFNVTVNSWRPKNAAKHQSKVGEQDKACILSSGSSCQEDKKPILPKGDDLHSECESTAFSTENSILKINRNDYNKEDFQTTYDAAKFFIIKSYSEDDVHKSIKYGVWSSTPNGNKRLDDAFRKALELPMDCPVFFFFSVNLSGQFCGVAEMVGKVDFNKNMDFWLEGKWDGCLPVKWHIIKDVPNSCFRHIILANNENKPVTHSRDTQEVPFQQGFEMLRLFKQFPIRTSLLDDFNFYDGRQRVLQERRLRSQQQGVGRYKQRPLEKIIDHPANTACEGKENDKPCGIKSQEGSVMDDECIVGGVKTEMEGTHSPNTVSSNGEDVVKCRKQKGSDGHALCASKPSSGGKDRPAEIIFNYKKALLEGKSIPTTDALPGVAK